MSLHLVLPPPTSIPTGLCPPAQGCELRAALGKGVRETPTPTGLRPGTKRGGRNPVGVGVSRHSSPRVTRGSQPWAGGHNPFGIGAVGGGSAGKEVSGRPGTD